MTSLLAAIAESPWDALVLVAATVGVTVIAHSRAVVAKLGKIELSVDAIDRAVNQRADGSTTVSADVDQILERVCRVEGRIGTGDGTPSTICEVLVEIQERLATGDDRFDRIEQRLDDRLAAIEDAVTSPSD